MLHIKRFGNILICSCVFTLRDIWIEKWIQLNKETNLHFRIQIESMDVLSCVGNRVFKINCVLTYYCWVTGTNLIPWCYVNSAALRERCFPTLAKRWEWSINTHLHVCQCLRSPLASFLCFFTNRSQIKSNNCSVSIIRSKVKHRVMTVATDSW